ncbi:hypothetical protein CAPTEDRAFT_60866, partial [Capitella teleta]
ENAVFDCELKLGDPKSAIHWYKDAKEIYKNKKYTMTFEDDIAELTIVNTGPNDSGKYRCEAVNKLG